MIIDNPYADRKLLRALEKAWARFEALLNRIHTSDFNPIYHLGTLSIYLLIIITVTGLYLTIFYRPGEEVAYKTVEAITSTWFGGLNRSIHRYASDGFLLVALIHGLKTLLSDRFWKSRWLAWVSGWALVIISWGIGTMGYWLVWDQRAQWLTEYMVNNLKGAIAITFVGADIAATSFAAFVIVLFVHIFLPISLLILTVVHILRLSRARLWSPRWLMISSLLALIILSIWRPAVSAAPANMDILIKSVDLDAWYLGFLPLIDRWGSLPFWGFMTVIFGVAILLPWISKGRDLGPAVVIDPNCTGCALCSAECPYQAIEMQYRDDDVSRFKSIAIVNEDLCTGCGLCVGTCATLGIELAGLPVALAYENGLQAKFREVTAAGGKPTVVFTCQRQATLGSLPSSFNLDYKTLGSGVEISKHDPPVFLGNFKSNGASRDNVITSVLPCIGMVDVDWVKEMLIDGAEDVVLLACAYDDCNYREGPQWTSNRLQRRKMIVKPNLHWLEAAPGDKSVIQNLFAIKLPQPEREKPILPVQNTRSKMLPGFSAALTGLALLLISFATALPLEFSAGAVAAENSQIRIVLQHSGNVITNFEDSNVVLPEGATVGAGQILGGQRYPVHVRVNLDGIPLMIENYQPSGLRSEGEITGMSFAEINPGNYSLSVEIDDNGEGWRTIFADKITLEPAQVQTIIYDETLDIFYLK